MNAFASGRRPDMTAGKRFTATLVTVLLICVFATAAVLMAGCKESAEDPPGDLPEPGVPLSLTGQWDCRETASDGETDTGFYALTISENGEFSLYDTTGNPGISGTMAYEGDKSSGTVTLDCAEDDFDPPFCWGIEPDAVLEYEVSGEDTIRLGYEEVWLTFDREER